MARVRLNEKHPLYQKLEKLFAVMDELEIELSVNCYGHCIVTSGEHEAQVVDLEDTGNCYQGQFGQFPPTTEWKLVKEK